MPIKSASYTLLNKVNSPQELKQLEQSELNKLCAELREFLLTSVSRSSGHLSSGLGTVELTVALHYVFNTPFDRLLWDVGHQAYPHKILTGRKDKLHTIKQKNGLHPFLWREESEFDHLSVGHSSTTISAALGMAIAAAKEQQDRKVIAVIGDGALTAGMAFEALNHAGGLSPKPNMLVILNDNEMSINKNVGALNNHFARLLSGNFYSTVRESSKIVLSSVPTLKELVRKTEEHLKGMALPSTIFESLGFNYIGPFDGHDLDALIATLRNMQKLKGPQLLHVKSTKGKGYKPAEQNPTDYHAVPKFNPAEQANWGGELPSYSKIFGNWLCETAAQNKKLIAITPAMSEGSGMTRFAQEYPEQFFDVAIAEQHAITLATGLAIEGYKPVVAIYSTFLQRGYDQLIHDVAIQNLPVLFAIDRAGIVGSDGATHQGAYDITFMRCIPNMVIMTPSSELECRNMLHTGFALNQPVAVRYPRGNSVCPEITAPLEQLEIGKSKTILNGKNIAILCFGTLLAECRIAAEKLGSTLVDMRFVKPLDQQKISELAQSHQLLITVEEGAIKGGAGSAVIEYLMAQKQILPVLNLGLPDEFIKHGSQKEVLAEIGLNAQGIENSILRYQQK